MLSLTGQRCLCLSVSACGLMKKHGSVPPVHGTFKKKSFSSPQVLSHNLYTVLNIPHDPVALEEHFQDDDDGPVSNHGYMPYLNKYILNKVKFGLKTTPNRCFQSGLYDYFEHLVLLLVLFIPFII